MTANRENRVDLLWRLAPWLTLMAMTMTVVSMEPAEGKPHGHGQTHAVNDPACVHMDAGHDTHVMKDESRGKRG